jgi:hypothetical protein
MSEADELRSLVAREHGLDDEAAGFLNGSTLAELEASAAALVKLLGQRHEEEPAAEAPNPFAGAAIAKDARQRALLGALTGRSPQRRDERGRYTSFDGGARQPISRPPESHDAWLIRLLRTRAADAGARL